jgi:maleate cis-trans isomerase
MGCPSTETWTVGSYLLGTSGEQELVSRVERHSNGIPVLMSAPAAIVGFRALEAERIALIHAPFFTDDYDQKGVAYFQEHGFEVVHVSHMMPPIDVPHPNTGSVASPAEIYEWVRSHTPSSAQAVFIGGNALHAIGVISALEEDLRRPVLTANQVSLWYALRVAGRGNQRAAAQVAGTSAPPSSVIRAPKRRSEGWGEIFRAISAVEDQDPPEDTRPRSFAESPQRGDSAKWT